MIAMNRVSSNDCRSLDTGTSGSCEVSSTRELLDTVASTPGALGYSEVGAAAAHDGVRQVRIDSVAATLESVDEGTYPFWETEIAYTYGEPPSDPIAAGFLRYLADEVGKDIIPARGHRPCAELDKPVLCRPSGPPSGAGATGSPTPSVPPPAPAPDPAGRRSRGRRR